MLTGFPIDMDRTDCFKVTTNGHGEKATYARFAHQPGEIVYVLQGPSSTERTRDTIEIGPGEHLDDSYARCINHSFTPNIEIRQRELVAIAEIAPGDEITFNYLANESRIASPFVCHETGQAVNSESCGCDPS